MLKGVYTNKHTFETLPHLGNAVYSLSTSSGHDRHAFIGSIDPLELQFIFENVVNKSEL